MRYDSKLSARGTVAAFPEHTGERIYMRPFYKADGLPLDLRRWQGVVNAMLDGVDTELPIFLMIDQAELKAGQLHRRGGLHIDGYWGGDGTGWAADGHTTHRALQAHGSTPSEPRHGSIPRTEHAPSQPRHGSIPADRHSPVGPLHSSRALSWGESAFDQSEAIILASNVSACRAIAGTFNGPIGEGGDCSNVAFDAAESIRMRAGTVYAGNVTMVHETLPVDFDCQRSVVRLNVPSWYP